LAKRKFTMHEQMIFDVIRKQAGTLSKAALEGVMNAVDANASEIKITLDEGRMTLSDDGKGFRSKKEIEDYFETFGRPHTEQEQKVFGKFRMGRGQMFAFGRNLWETGRFRMDVDVKDKGLDYDLKELSEKERAPGCSITIELYDQLLPSDVDKTVRDLELWCKWAPLRVVLNDREISSDPAAQEWQYETDEAYVSLTGVGGLTIYNQGVFVMDIPAYRYGTGGEVVTKMGQDLDVNFARNDILASCPIWKKVSPFIDQRATEKNTKKRALDDGARQRLAHQLKAGEEIESHLLNR